MSTELATVEQAGMIMTPAEAKTELARLQEFVQSVMKPGVDYGVIPGTGGKPTLLKPGAEKLNEIYGYAPHAEVIDKVENWTASPPFLYYEVKVSLVSKRTGVTVAEGVGSCNSMEVKYRYRTEWWNGQGQPAGQGWQRTKSGKWNRKIENTEIADIANTILKMAKKRALVDATLSATRSSEIFTQDVEDISRGADVIDADYAEAPPLVQSIGDAARAKASQGITGEPKQQEEETEAHRQLRELLKKGIEALGLTGKEVAELARDTLGIDPKSLVPSPKQMTDEQLTAMNKAIANIADKQAETVVESDLVEA